MEKRVARTRVISEYTLKSAQTFGNFPQRSENENKITKQNEKGEPLTTKIAMVLTNFECWANGSSATGIAVDIERRIGSNVGVVDLFSPRAVHQNRDTVFQAPTSAADVSHITSNGYYGFSHINPITEVNNDNNNNNNCSFNNLNTASMRCKKRGFVKDDDLSTNVSCSENGQDAGPKRCRYDDGFGFDTEQYFNDFFNMQAAANAPTQIGTQSSLMDTEDYCQQHLQVEPQSLQQQQQQQLQQQPQQRQVDVAMTDTSPHTNCTSSNAYQSSLQQQQPSQVQQQQQQLHFQGHLHRTNRDISRCLLSHMI